MDTYKEIIEQVRRYSKFTRIAYFYWKKTTNSNGAQTVTNFFLPFFPSVPFLFQNFYWLMSKVEWSVLSTGTLGLSPRKTRHFTSGALSSCPKSPHFAYLTEWHLKRAHLTNRYLIQCKFHSHKKYQQKNHLSSIPTKLQITSVECVPCWQPGKKTIKSIYHLPFPFKLKGYHHHHHFCCRPGRK